jgi:uncharacterized protein (DUF305 family)
MKNHDKTESGISHSTSYRKLIWMAIISFASMYILMYSMVDKFSNVIPNVNQFYMAAVMAAPMLIMELLIMRSMYKNKKLNTAFIAISGIVLVVCFLFIRNQTAVSDKQFLKSMIPHHAAAILMVEQTEIEDPEIKKLANDIITSQQREIDFMKAKLNELNSK